MEKVLWCCQHQVTVSQEADLPTWHQVEKLQEVAPELFEKLANLKGNEDLEKLALELSGICDRYDIAVMPIGSPAFMFSVAKVLRTPAWFSHSERESVETVAADGTVSKTAVFKHRHYIKI